VQNGFLCIHTRSRSTAAVFVAAERSRGGAASQGPGGPALDYYYDYEELKFIVEGEFHLVRHHPDEVQQQPHQPVSLLDFYLTTDRHHRSGLRYLRVWRAPHQQHSQAVPS
jgi:hypothetical protein